MVKTGGTKVPLPGRKDSAFNVGDKLICVKSHSVGYTEGKTYEVYQNSKGWRVLQADDGFEDIVSMLVSEFKKE